MTHPHPLQTYRKARDLSVAALAEALGVRRTTVHRWEQRKRVIDRKLVASVSEKTGIPADELLELDQLTGATA